MSGGNSQAHGKLTYCFGLSLFLEALRLPDLLAELRDCLLSYIRDLHTVTFLRGRVSQDRGRWTMPACSVIHCLQ